MCSRLLSATFRPFAAAFLLGCCMHAGAATAAPSFTSLAGMPLFFEAEGAQASGSFIARGQNCQVHIEANGARIHIARPLTNPTHPRLRASVAGRTSMQVRSVRMELVGADPGAAMSGMGRTTTVINELTGGPSEWQTAIPTWSQVKASSIYPGIDVVYYGNQQNLEYDFHVSPGADPNLILLKFAGIDSLTITEAGELLLAAGGDEIRQLRPVIYQYVDGERREVSGGFQIRGKHQVGFRLGEYRADLPLIIDPVLSYASYFGGSSGDIALAIRLGPDQSIYVAGQTLSRRFLFTVPADGFQRTFAGGEFNGDAFVARFDASGTNLIYFTYLGGRAEDGALDLAVDSEGRAYVAGFTTSPDFPTQNPMYARIRGQKNPYTGTYPKSGFVAALNASGSSLLYSTYLGGTKSDVVTAIAVDSTGAACVTGTTVSSNFPVVNALPGQHRRSRGQDAFISKLTPGGTSLLFSTYFGGNLTDAGQGIACRTDNSIYVTGYSSSGNLPITNAFQATVNSRTNVTGAIDAWVAKFSPAGEPIYSTFLGGTANDAAFRVAVDAAGDAYIAGYSQSQNFPHTVTNFFPGVTNRVAPSFANSDAFLAKIGVSASGVSELRYSILLGGYGSDTGWDVAVTPAGAAYTVGITTSPNFPTNNTSGYLSRTNNGRADVFITAISAGTPELIYSGYLGGRRNDFGYGVAVSPGGEAYITGRTVSQNFPSVNALQSSREGANDAFIAVISPEPVLQTTAVAGGWELRWWGGIGPEYTLEASTLPAGADWSPVPVPVKRDGGYRSVRVSDTDGVSGFFRLRRQ